LQLQSQDFSVEDTPDPTKVHAPGDWTQTPVSKLCYMKKISEYDQIVIKT